MLELIEKILASLLIFALVIFLMFLVFPEGLQRFVDQTTPLRPAPTETPQQALKSPTTLPKGNVLPSKTVARLPDSSGNTKPIYVVTRRQTPKPTPPPPKKRPYHPQSTPMVVRDPIRHIIERNEPDYIYAGSFDSCVSCLCDCNNPYWSSNHPFEAEECWDY